MSSILNDADRWRERAKEARMVADQITDAEAKRTMLDIADSYDRIAQRADYRALDAKRGN